MSAQIQQLKAAIEPLRQEIIKHKVYTVIKDVEDLKIFMKYHVYAVWDFMSLLKTLQNNLTCTRVPWYPVGSATTRHLINEIVVGEESDVDAMGVRKSHFELYIDGMLQAGANEAPILNFIEAIKQGKDFETAFQESNTPSAAREFVDFTFEVIGSEKAYLQAAIFTFGREDLIPGMFMSLVNELHKTFPESVSVFKYYLERHIEVDGDHHSHLALEMTEQLCQENESFWAEASTYSLRSLQKRIALWDGVYEEICKNKGMMLNS